MVGTPKPVLQKSVFQARYKPELEFYRRLYVAAQKLEGFPLWQTDRLSVTLFNQEKHCSAGIAFESFSYTQDSPNLEQESAYMSQILKVLPEELNISSFVRFGLRRWYLVPVNEAFDDLVKILVLKLSSPEEELKAILPKEMKDLTHVFVFKEDQYGFRIILGPMRKTEIPTHVPFDREHHLEAAKRAELELELMKQYPDVSVYVDVDMFRQEENLTCKDAVGFFDEAHQRATKIASGITDYLFRTKVEKQ